MSRVEEEKTEFLIRKTLFFLQGKGRGSGPFVAAWERSEVSQAQAAVC